MAKKTYDESIPVIWCSNGETIESMFGKDFNDRWFALHETFRKDRDALLADASLMVKAPAGKETVVFPGKGSSIGIKFLEPEAAKEARPKAKSDKPSLESQLAALGATLVKRGQTMKDAGVAPTPVITGKAKRA